MTLEGMVTGLSLHKHEEFCTIEIPDPRFKGGSDAFHLLNTGGLKLGDLVRVEVTFPLNGGVSS